MNEQLEKFVTLKQDPRVSTHDNAELRSFEEQLRKNPDDEDAIAGLIDRQQKLFQAYRFVVRIDHAVFSPTSRHLCVNWGMPFFLLHSVTSVSIVAFHIPFFSCIPSPLCQLWHSVFLLHSVASG